MQTNLPNFGRVEKGSVEKTIPFSERAASSSGLAIAEPDNDRPAQTYTTEHKTHSPLRMVQ